METPPMRDPRKGFSLVEMLVVTVLGSLVLLATYNVLITNQRTYTVNAANIQGQQTVRAAMELLFSELREISPAGGDLLRMREDSVTIRVMRSAGIVCDSVPLGQSGLSSNPPWKVVSLGDTVATGDSAWVFAEKNPQVTADDTWFPVAVTVRNDDATCGGRPGQALRFVGPTMLAADTPTIGSLVRTYQTFTYGLGVYNGDPYLIRALEPGGATVPLVGPLRAATGVHFQYLDADGNATNVPGDVRQMVVTLRTRHDARDAAGQQITDSLTTRIYTRN
jgi:prepilin-type N-terminal cleavage/methylation domain-containing protein